MSEGLFRSINVIRCHTSTSGNVGSVVFDRLPTWSFITSRGVWERFPLRRSGFFDEFRLIDVGQVASKRSSQWRQQTGTSFKVRSPLCPKVINRMGQLLTASNHRKFQSDTGETTLENHFLFAATTEDCFGTRLW